ncbi:MAG: ABC transporter permease [Bacilli bacterium]|nr:ABC transporter permease [Bacilli bacterium]
MLGTFFYMAFSNIEKKETLDIIPIAVVNNEDYEQNVVMKEALMRLSEEGENQLFQLTHSNEATAQLDLQNNEISGYLLFQGDDVHVVVAKSGIDGTILRFVIDEINGQKKMIENLVGQKVTEEIQNGREVDIDFIVEEVKQMILNSSVNIKNVSSTNMSYTMIEYYTLIAMACLYSSMISMFITNYKLANMKTVGKRIVVSPSHKVHGLFGSLVASYFVGAIGLALLFLYTLFVLGVDYGNRLWLVIFLASIGLFAGQMLGMVVSVLIKANENTKTGVLVALSMFGSFLSGMMGITMKYVIDTHAPILNLINPVAMITDGLYSLYYYDTLTRFWFDVSGLVIFSFVMIMISFRGLRRQKYDSI